RYGVSLIHLDASAEYLPGLPTFDRSPGTT
ncbi:DUF5983 family protein, partial [Escherichia coli]|nr:DUF5983 family protein [Escherichia coli]MCN2212359.1 DUF5983 family protein [Escherichia coli]MCN2368622.1 DUF5983 family protein [Escherichia coli]MCN3080886.1 DUF5983 family protein [Escherichia coli]MCN3149022.1 DUF5983 family protein [Escherichia coli]